MSEYQYYEFRTVDRELTPAEMNAVRAVSTRAKISPTRFVNEYHFGDFNGDAWQFMRDWYDAHIYYANWGTAQVMFALPAESMDEQLWRQYLPADFFNVDRPADRAVVMLATDGEAGDEVDEKDWMRSLLPLREELMSGDLRPLYLGWLAAVLDGTLGEDAAEPPVPAGLSKLSRAQKSLVQFLRIDDKLLRAAAMQSPKPVTEDAGSLVDWINQLPEADVRSALAQTLGDDSTAARAKLLRDFRSTTKSAPPGQTARTAADLLNAAGFGD